MIDTELHIIEPVEYHSELVIHEGLVVKFATPAPNWWVRLWTRIMFGWHWRTL